MKMRFQILLACCLCSLQLQAQSNPLNDCPKSPNCFRSEFDTKQKSKKALAWSGDIVASQQKLKTILEREFDATLDKTAGDKLYFSFVTKLGKFTDKVSFYFDQNNGLIHFRSASQIGWSDLGANKRRMKKIRKLWNDSHS